MKAALVVDHPMRDLPGLVLVARDLAVRGVEVILVPYNLASTELPAVCPDVVLLPHLRRLDEELAATLLDVGISIVVLDTEGGVVESLDSYARIFSSNRGILDQIKTYCGWGSKISDHLVASGRLRRDQIVLTGSPRFDFYAPQWRKAAGGYSGRRTSGNLGKTVLLIGTFTLANPRFRSQEDEVRFLVEESNWDPNLVGRRLEAEQKCFDGLIDLANELSSWQPDLDWVLRPHPFENLESYRRDLRSGVRVCSEGTVDQLILQSRVLIHRGSTTSVEAALAGIPALTPGWLPDWAQVRLIGMASQECPDIGALKNQICGCLDDEAPASCEQSSFIAAMGDWFSEIDGMAHRRVADVLLAASDLPSPSTDRCLKQLNGVFEGGLSGPIGRVRTLLGVPIGFSLRRLRAVDSQDWWDRSAKFFGPQRVSEVLEQINRAELGALGPGHGVEIEVSRARESGGYVAAHPFGRAVMMKANSRR